METILQILVGIHPWLISWNLEDVYQLTGIGQNVIVIIATIFTAWWAYSTFGHKDKRDELQAIARKIVEIHAEIDKQINEYNLHMLQLEIHKSNPVATHEENQRFSNNKVARINSIKNAIDELNVLYTLSLSVPVSFRIHRMSGYEYFVRANIDIKKLANDGLLASMVREQRAIMLASIDKEINGHWLWIKMFQIKFKDSLSHVKRSLRRRFRWK